MLNHRGLAPIILTLTLAILLGVVGAGFFYFSNRAKKAEIPSPTIVPSSSINLTSSPSNPFPDIQSPNIKPNYSQIDSDSTTITSANGKKIARFYYKGLQRYEGDPTLSNVDVLDKDNNQTTTYYLDGAITRAQDLYWSPVDNRIYFTLGTNGIGTYALWSSDIDGSNSRLIAGSQDGILNGAHFADSAIYGAEAWDFSPDGKTIVTARWDYTQKNLAPFWIMNYDGSNSHSLPIQGDYKNISSIKWQADGIHFVFTMWDGQSNISYITDKNGVTPKQTTRDPN